jgi:hypothetical protein
MCAQEKYIHRWERFSCFEQAAQTSFNGEQMSVLRIDRNFSGA